MSKKILKTKTQSVPSGLGRQLKDDDSLDNEFDKIFHPEKFDVAQLNPTETGYVDEERKKYYRSSSIDEGASCSIPGLELETARPDSGKRSFARDEPLQDQGIRNVASDGNFPLTWDLEGGHSKQEFAHNNPIMTKIKSGHGKHRKTSDPTADNVRKKHRKPSANAQAGNLSGIPEGEVGEGRVEEEDDEEEEKEGSNERSQESSQERSVEPEESKASLPWKIARDDDPVLYSEDWSGSPGQEPVLSDRDQGDKSDTPEAVSEEKEGHPRSGGVKFHIGEDEEKEDPNDANSQEYKKNHRKFSGSSRKSSKKERLPPEVQLEMRRRQGSELHEKMSQNVLYEEEDVENLMEGDIEEIAGHRFEKAKGQSKHKISHTKPHMVRVGQSEIKDIGKDMKMMSSMGYGYRTELDHSPHELFVEMDELEAEEWVERARWIKYEEDLEAECGRWGKPHVASLTFHSLINLRLCMESGTLLLDISARDLPELVHRVVEDLSEKGIIEEDQKAKVLRVLLYRHKHVHPHTNTFKFGLKRSMSQRSIQTLGLVKSFPVFYSAKTEQVTLTSPNTVDNCQGLLDNGRKPSMRKNSGTSQDDSKQDANFNNMENGFVANKDEDQLVLDMSGAHGGLKKNSSQGSFKRNESFDSMIKARKQDIRACMEKGTEGAIVLVGALDDIDKPIVAFVRLAEAIEMHNTIEVNLPVRFIFILLTPSDNLNMDHHEIGRSFCTLMSNPAFHTVAYRVEGKQELLHAINEFLDDSVVLPPGDWDRKHILPMNEIIEMRQRRKARKGEKDGDGDGGGGGGDPGAPKDEDKEPPKRNPLSRTKMPFGGLIDDIKYRYPLFLQDIKDGLNSQCVAATIFIYFAALSGAIAFGGIMGSKTNNDIGISETLIMTSVCGVIFALLSGCPLIIIGTTGPVLLYDEALYQFCQDTLPKQFLYWRVWVGIWTFIISLVIAGFQGSTLVRYFTKFTKDIFAALVSLLFIYTALDKLYNIFLAHPLMGSVDYCAHYSDLAPCVESLDEVNNTRGEDPLPLCEANFEHRGPQPNTALLSMILMFGTFFIAYFLRIFRNSQFLGRNARRALGDFGVPIAIVIMVLVDYSSGDTYTEKLKVPEGLTVTNSAVRGWLIPPWGSEESPLAVWAMFAAILPAILLYLLLFMETHICELIMMEKTKEEKGAGLHLDIVLLSCLNMFCALFGGPWICAATVRAVSHVSALTVLSTTNVPGEAPKVIGVRDQRVTATVVSIMIGASVLMAPILQLVPFAVLYGVFLYMGVSGMNGVQFFDRLTLCFMPVKHHPNVSYVKKVKTWRMVMFTVFQGLGLVILWVVKSTSAALAFPFFVVGMIPYRLLLKCIFTDCELIALDGAQAGKSYEAGAEEAELDFYETANDCPITPATQMPLHRSLMGLVNIPTLIGKKGKGSKRES
eukprot:GFUD01031630.1.p1 GENE.GFUD01031630.1~~GFUD01031630.1.p1  ORF type:complete len:1420 (+),score=451.00 GFUD01031630.1:163-4422(+)